MANQLTNGAKDISPLVLAPDVPTSNNLTAAFAGWASDWYSCEGTPNHGLYQSTREVNVRFDYDFSGATAIEIYPELATPSTKGSPAPAAFRDAAGESQIDQLNILAANMLTTPVGSIDHSFSVQGASQIRFRARAIGGATPSLAASITAG